MKRLTCLVIALLLWAGVIIPADAAVSAAPSVQLSAEHTPGLVSAAITIRDVAALEGAVILVCSLYDGNNKMLGTALFNIASVGEDAYPVYFRQNTQEAAVIKAFLLRAQTLTPLCAQTEIDVPEIAKPGGDMTEDIPLG